MASQGPLYPSTTADSPSTGSVAWSNHANAKTENGSVASAALGTTAMSHYLSTSGYGPSIPAGVTIDGIKLEVKGYYTGLSSLIADNSVMLVKGGVRVGGDRARASNVYWTASNAWVTFGGPTDLWDETWSPSDFDANFGAVYSAWNRSNTNSGTVNVDAVRITVYYTTPPVLLEGHGVSASVGTGELAPLPWDTFGGDGVSASAGSGSLEILTPTYGQRLRLDILDANGNFLFRVPVVNAASFHLGQDQVGDFVLSLPASDARVAQIEQGQRVVIYREGEGCVFRGIVDKGEITEDAGGELAMVVTGSSKARELVFLNTLSGRFYTPQNLQTIIMDMINDTDWTGAVAISAANHWPDYIGVSFWEAIADAASREGWHVRENNVTSRLDVGPLGDSSGLIIRKLGQATGWNDTPGESSNVLPMTSIRILESQQELWNYIQPLGLGGDENNYDLGALSLEHASRTYPYTIEELPPNSLGRASWIIQDLNSVKAYGVRQRSLRWKIDPADTNFASITEAANALYDQAALWLQWHAETKKTYEVSFVNLKHFDHGEPVIQCGDTVRLVYRGFVARDLNGQEAPRVWKDIDAELRVMEMARTFNEDGSDTWQVKLSTSDQAPPSDPEVISEAVTKIQSGRRWDPARYLG